MLDLTGRRRAGRLLALALVGGVHAGAVGVALGAGARPTAPMVSPPLVGSLVSAPAGEPGPRAPAPSTATAPRPLPLAPRRALTPPRPAPVPSAPLPAGPTSALAVSSLTPEAVEPEPVGEPAEEGGADSGVGAGVTVPRSDANFLSNPAPAYPRLSRRLREEGRVLLDVLILADGTVREARLRRSSGHPRLDGAALEAVRRWRYVPAYRGDEPIDFWHVQPVDFELSR